MPPTPVYLDTGPKELAARADALYSLMKECRLCARRCHAKRSAGETGECGATDRLYVSSAFAHFGEEPPLTGLTGSGTVFLTNCNLHCLFCQNYDISHQGEGQPITTDDLAEMMLALQQQGVHNINMVTPTHYAPHIVEALGKAAETGLTLPLVWNCGGYESTEALQLLDGVVDIYMPDVKFFNADSARTYLNASDYPETVRACLAEMNRQVGPLQCDETGIAHRGMLIRHLVMPGHGADTENILHFIADELGNDHYVNLMDQYRPLYKADRFEEINRRPSTEEMAYAYNKAEELGLTAGLL